MQPEKVYAMRLAAVYPLLVAKAVRKGRTQEEVDAVISWLTGYAPAGRARAGRVGCDIRRVSSGMRRIRTRTGSSSAARCAACAWSRSRTR